MNLFKVELRYIMLLKKMKDWACNFSINSIMYQPFCFSENGFGKEIYIWIKLYKIINFFQYPNRVIVVFVEYFFVKPSI